MKKKKMTGAVLTLGALLFGMFAWSASAAINVNYKVFPFSASVRDQMALGDDGNMYYPTIDGGTYHVGAIWRLGNGTNAVISSFDGTNTGSQPISALYKNPGDGYFYGTTLVGTSGNGNLYRVDTNGNLTNIVSFGGTNGTSPGSAPVCGDGTNTLFGENDTGGANSYGTLYAYSLATHSMLWVKALTSSNYYTKGLVYMTNYLFLVSSVGGPSGYGTISRIGTDGTGLTNVYVFTNGTDGKTPNSLMFDPFDGKLHGTTTGTNSYNAGTEFSFDPNTSAFVTEHSWTEDASLEPNRLALGPDGALYGFTDYSGDNDGGFCFKILEGHYAPLFSVPVANFYARVPCFDTSNVMWFASSYTTNGICNANLPMWTGITNQVNDVSGNGISYTWPSVSGQVYDLYVATNGTSTFNLITNITASGAQTTYSNASFISAMAYVKVETNGLTSDQIATMGHPPFIPITALIDVPANTNSGSTNTDTNTPPPPDSKKLPLILRR